MPYFGELMGKVEIFSNHNLLSEISSCLSENCNFLLPSTFF